MTVRRTTLIVANLAFCFMLFVLRAWPGHDLMVATGSPKDYAWIDLIQGSGYSGSFSPAAPGPIDEDAAAASSDIQVVGILINGDRRLAIVLTDGADGPRRVSEGDRVQGRKISRIRPRSIVVGETDNHLEYPLDPSRSLP